MKITVKRLDGAIEVYALDEDTSEYHIGEHGQVLVIRISQNKQLYLPLWHILSFEVVYSD
jgi:hypothetical protein